MMWMFVLLALAGLLFLAGAYAAWRRGDRRRSILMIVAGAVMLGNVALWFAPTEDGKTLFDHASKDGAPLE